VLAAATTSATSRSCSWLALSKLSSVAFRGTVARIVSVSMGRRTSAATGRGSGSERAHDASTSAAPTTNNRPIGGNGSEFT
jgi:hypothetical protein